MAQLFSPRAKRKRLLVVLFIPSMERDGTTEIDQDRWVESALALLATLFGGATAFPRAKGIWRDDERGGTLVKDNPVILHCYTSPKEINNSANQASLAAFCRHMGRETHQGEIGLVIDNEYLAITKFDES